MNYSCRIIGGIAVPLFLSGCAYFSDPELNPISHHESEVSDEIKQDGSYTAGFSIGISNVVYKNLSMIKGFSFSGDETPTVYASTGYDLTEPQDNQWLVNSHSGVELKWISTADNPSFQNFFNFLDDSNQSTHPWDRAHAMVAVLYSAVPAQLHSEYGADIVAIVEPEFVYTNTALSKYNELQNQSDDGESIAEGSANVKKPPSPVWPGGEPLWYQRDDYSQLSAAREATYKYIASLDKPPTVKLAHLDTGYNASDKFRPSEFKYDQAIDFTNKQAKCSFLNQYSNPKLKSASHGQRTLSVLAGNEIEWERGRGFLGGDPHAEVTEYRIAKFSVVHLIPKNMTAAISCAVDNEFDIVSMSAGGFPSIAQRNAVNRAYQNGVAMFAATGDFFHIPFINKNILGTSIVYPARYSRVIAVAGVTAAGKSYGVNPKPVWKLFFTEGKFWTNLFDWSLRGSYGPEYAMKDHSIAAYGPNVTNSLSISDQDNSIGLNGAGTSNTTPQAAAAASLWLKLHKHEFSDDEWRSWEKAEAVYSAMMRSADKKNYGDISYFGEGALKASDMLGVEYKNHLKGNIKIRPSSTIGFLWLVDTLRTANISFSGARVKIYLDMLVTELEQAAFMNSKSLRYYDAYLECKVNSGSKDDCALEFYHLAKNLLERKKGAISNALRAQLLEYFNANGLR